MASPQVEQVEQTDTDVDEVSQADRPWVTIVWNDPVNLMSYVTWVFQKLFGYSRDKAEKLMLDVHHKGKAVVSSGARERMEFDASRLQAYGLWATVDQP
jgi:ATP-dependent Clp protease adaptor protein ClpS